ncbi:ArsA family ATPase [bacterium]|nr:ArsA family ATPase [bacterium]
MQKPVSIFFVGKGGVGKSTVAALCAVSFREGGRRALVVSMDPAHNLSDIFEKKLSDKPHSIIPGLSAMEVDEERWAMAYLDEIREQINRTYSYLTAFNLEKYFKVIKHSPGLEEYALILAFNKIRKDFISYDYIIFDMPPTALALKFFNLPALSLVWIDQLINFRREIIEKRKIITKIRFMKKESETDKIYNRLNTKRDYFLSLKDEFENIELSKINLVTNPDTLSFAESERIYSGLKEMNIDIERIICNKMQKGESNRRIKEVFTGIPVTAIATSETPLLGLENLKEFLRENEGLVFV